MQVLDLQGKSADEILGNRSRRQQSRGSSRGALRGYPHCYPQRRWITCRCAQTARRPSPREAAGERRGHNRAAPRSQARLHEDDLFSIIQAAGWPIWPLILCSIVALTIVIERLFSLRASQIAPASLLDEVLSRHAQQPARQPTWSTSWPTTRCSAACWPPACAASSPSRASPRRRCASPSRAPAASRCTAWSATSTRWARSPRRRRCSGCSAR